MILNLTHCHWSYLQHRLLASLQGYRIPGSQNGNEVDPPQLKKNKTTKHLSIGSVGTWVKRRGRPPKYHCNEGNLSLPLKKKAKNHPQKWTNTVRANWENKVFDLKIDLENQFVLVENDIKQSSGCIIEEVTEDAQNNNSQDFQFGVMGTCPKKSSQLQ